MSEPASSTLLRRPARAQARGAPVVIVGLALVLAFPAAARADHDETPPVIALTITGTRGANGWYTSNVGVAWAVGDAESGIASTSGCDAVTVTGETTGTTLSCSAVNGDSPTSRTSGLSFTVKIDRTPPEVTGADWERQPDADGWYNHPVSVTFAGADAVSGIESCTGATYTGPDASGASVSGTCRDRAGNVSAGRTVDLAYDGTPPQVTAAVPDRPPDANGWYNHPVTFAFAGTDATSGVAACTTVGYGGGDGEGATVTGNCRDRAGNEGPAAPFSFKYDATAPRLRGVTVETGDHRASLAWRGRDLESVQILRSPGKGRQKQTAVYRGAGRSYRDWIPNGVEHRYVLVGWDRAGNRSRAVSVVALPKVLLLQRSRRVRVAEAPVLRWTPARRATYYNLQLYRGSRKVLSAWSRRPQLVLPARWRYAGQVRRLEPGTYRWYVWPGLGPRSDARYGRLLGQGRFVVPRRP